MLESSGGDARRGLIITNSHIIDHADEITVKLTDGRALSARPVGADPETDVAVMLLALLLRGRRPEVFPETTNRAASTTSITIRGGLSVDETDHH